MLGENKQRCKETFWIPCAKVDIFRWMLHDDDQFDDPLKGCQSEECFMIMSQIRVIAIRRVKRSPLGCMKEMAKGSRKEKAKYI